MMKYLFALLLSISLSTNAADIWTLYDGDGSLAPADSALPQSGVTRTHWNRAAWIVWRNPGSDWVDAAGTPQGTVPLASWQGRGTVGQDIDIEVTPLLAHDGITLRSSGAYSITFASRETATPPRLIVTLMDGSVVESVPVADSTISTSTANGVGKSPVLSPAHAVVMQFPRIMGDVASAVLRLRVTASTGAVTLNAFGMVAPRTVAEPVTTGYAVNYPADKGIEQDPRTWYAENWDDPANWWKKDGNTSTTPTPSWKQDGGLFLNPNFSGMWIANGGADVPAQCTETTVPRGTGYEGNGLMGVHCPTILARGVEVPSPNIRELSGGEKEEAWARFYIKYGVDHLHFKKCEGGKAPGLSGDNTVAGNSGMPGWGIRGWSMRTQFQFVCDPANPAYRRIVYGVYNYDGGRLDSLNGGMMNNQDLTLLETDRWYCIEQRVKINTPGVNDGIVELYLDGRRVVNRTDVLFRSVKPAQGYGLWEMDKTSTPAPANAPIYVDHRGARFWLKGKTLPGDLGIVKFWGMVHGGGKTPTGKSAQFWYDQTVVGSERIGCMAPAGGEEVLPPPPPPPPPPPLTDLEIAQAALAKAMGDLGEAHARITALEVMVGANAALVDELRATATAAEERAAAARQTIQSIRDLVREQ